MTYSWYCSKTGCVGMGMCCEKKRMIGGRNVWSMKWRVPGQEVDQRKLGKRLWEDCRARGLNREDAMDRSRWRKQIGMIDDRDECE